MDEQSFPSAQTVAAISALADKWVPSFRRKEFLSDIQTVIGIAVTEATGYINDPIQTDSAPN